MNDQIFETVVTTCSEGGAMHVAPMGVRHRGERVVLKPFRPSTTLDNLLATRRAVLNVVDDVRVFAGCVTGRRAFATIDVHRAGEARAPRLACALEHALLRLEEVDDDAERPTLVLARMHEARHAPWRGFNRAQAAVIEGAVLVSRLRMLPAAKVDSEMAYLQIAIDKTAGPEEREAWAWLVEAVAHHRSESPA